MVILAEELSEAPGYSGWKHAERSERIAVRVEDISENGMLQAMSVSLPVCSMSWSEGMLSSSRSLLSDDSCSGMLASGALIRSAASTNSRFSTAVPVMLAITISGRVVRSIMNWFSVSSGKMSMSRLLVGGTNRMVGRSGRFQAFLFACAAMRADLARSRRSKEISSTEADAKPVQRGSLARGDVRSLRKESMMRSR
ncbi:MAG: hypothetical protein BWY66_01444 [bacterium ADurb.Bin374]|nr:MAG: hypothetical protein BWY66_01444 [bacterium ADurb.Bin374]